MHMSSMAGIHLAVHVLPPSEVEEGESRAMSVDGTAIVLERVRASSNRRVMRIMGRPTVGRSVGRYSAR